MSGRRRWVAVWAYLGWVGLLAPALQAQAGARLAGTVRSQSGGAIAGAELRFSADDATTRTDAAGRFRLEVPAGTPGELRVSAGGHQPLRLQIGALRGGQLREVAVTLRRAFALSAVEVVAERERPLLNTEDASTGGTVERVELAALPTDARNPLTLAFTIPGVAQATGFFGDAPPLSINGANSLYTQYLVDGLDNNEGFLGGPRVEFPLAGIRRFGVLANSYPSEFGRSSNGVVNLETRAGGERFSGEVFVFARPGYPLDAVPAGVDRERFERQEFHRYQFGGAVGGPLIRGRTFGFATVEYTDESENRIISTAQTGFPGSEIRRTWKGFGRLDHGWSPNQTTTVRFAISDLSRAGQGGGVVTPEADITTRRIGSITNLTHRTALRGGEASNRFSAQLGTFRWFFPPTRSDFSRPQVSIVGSDLTTTEAVVGSSNFVFDERELQLQLQNVLESRLRDGAHTFRLGADLASSRFALDAAGTNPLGAYTVVNEGNIRTSGPVVSFRDIPQNVRVLSYTVDARQKEVDLTQMLWGAFVEDQWRVSPSLTVNLGVRWDYDDITSRGRSEPDLNNFQPRGSFNWYATPQSVVRGGAGIYTGKFPYAVYSDAIQFGPEGNVVVTFGQGGSGTPPAFGQVANPQDVARLREQALTRGIRNEVREIFARGLEQPESYQFTLGYQRQVSERWGLSVDGVWVETRHLPRSFDLNAITRRPGAADTVNRTAEFGDQFRPTRPAPGGFRRLTTTESGGNSDYLGLYTTLRRRVSEGLSLEGSWVWSRARNDTEDINFNAAFANDFAAEWADAVNDRRHKVTLRGLRTFGDRLRLGVIADYQTGTPLNRVAYFRDLDGSGAIFGNGFIGNHDRLPGVGRNSERLPSSFQFATSLTGLVPLLGHDLELRADLFNLFNQQVVSGFANGIPGGGPRTQVGRPGDPVVYNAFGSERQLQLSARYVF